MSVNTLSLREASSCFIDANSAARNGTATVGSFRVLSPAANTFLGVSSLAAGVVGVPIGLAVARDGYKQVKAAAKARHLEGVVHHGLWSGAGAGYAGLSGLLGTSGLYALQGKVAPAFITPAFADGGIAMYGAFLAHAGHGLWKTAKFNAELKKREDQEALGWLNEQLFLTEKEEVECAQAEDVAKEKERLLLKKFKQFELRTSASCAAHVREKLPGLLAHFDPTEARELIEEVDKACFKQRVKYVLLIAIAVLGIAASICVLVLSGPASPLLFAIGALAWFTLDSSKLHDYLGEKFWDWLGKKEVEGDRALLR